MKEKHRILLMAVIISAIITSIISGIILINTRQTESLPQSQAFFMEGIVEDTLGNQPYVPYWQLGLISVICFVVFVIIFYFIIGKLKKPKT